MGTLLHIDSSPRGENSSSRLLAGTFTAAWKEIHPDDKVIYRDLRNTSIPHITEEWIAADFTPRDALRAEQRQVLGLSDILVDEFLAAGRCLYSVPMYNFGSHPTSKLILTILFALIEHLHLSTDAIKGLQKRKRFFLSPLAALSMAQARPIGDGMPKSLG